MSDDPHAPTMPQAVSDEAADAETLRRALEPFEAEPVIRVLQLTIRELGSNARDEVLQFRELQKACRKLPALAAAVADAGFGDPVAMDPRAVTPDTGRLIQAFNRLVEERWNR